MTLPCFQIIWFQFSSDCNCYISAVGNVPSDSSLQLPAPRQTGLQVSQKIKHYLDDEDDDEKDCDEDDGDLYFSPQNSEPSFTSLPQLQLLHLYGFL